MALARYEGTAVDTAGNVIPNATVEVRRDQPGRPVVPLWADREGTVALGNPILTDPQGGFAFHVAGGVFYIRIFTGPSQQPTFQKILRYVGIGTAAERDVEDLASALETGTATFATLPELQAFIPSDVGVGGKVTTGEDAGFYHYDTIAEEWVFDRYLYDTLARMNVTGGTADAIVAETATGVADSTVVMLWIEAPGDNTGPVTINGKEVLTAGGNSLIAGQWNEGRTYWFSDEGATYKLRTESDVDGIATQVEIWANEALANKNYAEEWAQSDDPITVEAGGDGVNDKSAKAWAADSADSAILAAGYAAGVNLPAIMPGDAGKQLFVNDDEDGYVLEEGAVVSYEPQSLTAPQQAQARENIGAAAYVSTSVARSISGLVPFNSASAPTNRIGISPGSARDKDNSLDIVLLAGIEKRIDQVFAGGNNNGGRDVATAFAANTGVHIFLIWNPTTEVADILFSQSAASPVMPTGFANRRRIGCFMLNASAQPYPGIWYANGDFYFKEPFLSASGVLANTTALTTLAVPAGVKMQARYNVVSDDSAGGNPAFGIVFSDPDLGPPVTNLGLLAYWKMAGGTDVGRVSSWTDTASRVYAGGFYGRATSTLSLYPVGWTDLRDEFA